MHPPRPTLVGAYIHMLIYSHMSRTRSKTEKAEPPTNLTNMTCISITSTCTLGLDRFLADRWPEGNEADALHLAQVVEADDADIGVRVLLLDLLHLVEHLCGVGAPEHRQLPHCPVSTVVVPGRAVVLTEDEANLAELEAGHPLGADQVVDLL